MLVQPAFHRQRIAAVWNGDGRARRAGFESLARWRDLRHESRNDSATLGNRAKTLFDADVDSEADEIGEAMTAIMRMFNLLMFPFAELLEKLPLPQVRRFDKMRSRLDATIYRFIDERRKSGEDRGDLLSMLLLAQDDENGNARMSDSQGAR
jgi:cytochrome P450